MTGGAGAASFVSWGAVVSAACGFAAFLGSAAVGLGPDRWLAAGWLAAAIPGVAGGAWLARRFGRPGAAFMVPLGVSMGIRALALAAGLVAAMRSAEQAPWNFLLGFGAGFLPLVVFEAVWFSRRAKTIP